MLHEQMKKSLLQTHQELKTAGKLLTEQQRNLYLGNFRSRFGPDQLGKLDGERLLRKDAEVGRHTRARGEGDRTGQTWA